MVTRIQKRVSGCDSTYAYGCVLHHVYAHGYVFYHHARARAHVCLHRDNTSLLPPLTTYQVNDISIFL